MVSTISGTRSGSMSSSLPRSTSWRFLADLSTTRPVCIAFFFFSGAKGGSQRKLWLKYVFLSQKLRSAVAERRVGGQGSRQRLAIFAGGGGVC